VKNVLNEADAENTAEARVRRRGLLIFSIRAQRRELAAAYGAAWHVIECVCSDRAIHQARLTSRQRGIPG